MQMLQNVQRDAQVAKLKADVKQLHAVINDLLPTFSYTRDEISINAHGQVTRVSVGHDWRVFAFDPKHRIALHLFIMNGHWYGPEFWRIGDVLYFEFTHVMRYVCQGPLLLALLERLKALDVPELSEQRRAALRQFLELAAQLAVKS
jgi:hypothetical protein